jgi:integrase/recombinase XerD
MPLRYGLMTVVSVAPSTLTVMTISTDVLPGRSIAGGLAGLGLAGWLGTMSPHTARAYEGDLRQFTAWLTARGINPEAVTPGVTTAWLADLAAVGQQVSTRRRKLAAVLSFYRYAAAEGALVTDPRPHQVPRLHRDDADTGALDNQQARRLWEATAGRPRIRALVAVLLFCGLRIGEALTLQVADLDTQQGATVLRVAGKGGKPRTAVLPAPAVVAIHDWLEQRGGDFPGPLLATSTSQAMDPRAAHRLIGRLGDRAGIAGLHPHTLRHLRHQRRRRRRRRPRSRHRPRPRLTFDDHAVRTRPRRHHPQPRPRRRRRHRQRLNRDTPCKGRQVKRSRPVGGAPTEIVTGRVLRDAWELQPRWAPRSSCYSLAASSLPRGTSLVLVSQPRWVGPT